ncbi:hypothetical protein XENTR_v10005351 [Xenopus tropicalis]|nr:hypothetical protein XENTR_v10005351 [Xenopus tropicalis]
MIVIVFPSLFYSCPWFWHYLATAVPQPWQRPVYLVGMSGWANSVWHYHSSSWTSLFYRLGPFSLNGTSKAWQQITLYC